MAGNEASFAFTAGDMLRATAYVGLASFIALLVFVSRMLPTMDAREPPLLKPTIPAIGHTIALIRQQTRFLPLLYKKSKLPIATLPMLGDRFYAVWDPSLVQAVFRNTQLSLLPLATEFAQKQLNLSENAANLVRTTDMMPEFTSLLHSSMTGKYVPSMNQIALGYISDELSSKFTEKQSVEVPSFYGWLRDLVTMATSEGLYGPGNILRHNLKLIDDLWDFETGQPELTLRPFPSITASKPWNARERLQAALTSYYAARHDEHEDASQMVKARAALLRHHGMTDDDFGQFELSLLHVSTSNTVPTVFWFAAFVLARSELVAGIREEVQAVVEKDGDVATVAVKDLEDKCPLLVRCYKESMRLSIHASNLRRVTVDTTVTDSNGNTYLLKAGANLALSSIRSHTAEEAWGPEATTFDPDRFLSAGDKAKRAAYHPFGGGRHLCPGRTFALAQILGFVAALVTGFDVSPLEGEGAPWKLPEMGHAALSEATVKPANHGEGFGVRVRRREGWERTKWVYKC